MILHNAMNIHWSTAFRRDILLSDAEMSITSKGLKCAPLKPSLNKYNVIHDCDFIFDFIFFIFFFFSLFNIGDVSGSSSQTPGQSLRRYVHYFVLLTQPLKRSTEYVSRR